MMAALASVSIVLPAYNEEPNLEQAVGEVTGAAERLFEGTRRARARDSARQQPRVRGGAAHVGKVDVIVGYRVGRQDTLDRRLMAYAWNMLVRVLFNVPVRDIDYWVPVGGRK